MKKKRSKAIGRKELAWEDLAPETRDLHLKILWMDGYSEQQIADFLLTTKGTIVGRRRRLRVGSGGRQALKKGSIDPQRFQDLLDIEKMDQLETDNGNVVCIAPVSDKADNSEATQDESVADESADVPMDEPSKPEEVAEDPEPLPARRNEAYHPSESESNAVQRTASRRKPKYQLTSNWRDQCAHKDKRGLQCGFVKEAGSEYCKLHGG